MVKVLLVVMATALLVVFGFQNSDHVPVSFVVGSPTKVRLIFLLLIAATAGFLLSYILGLNREIRLKKEVRRLLTVAGPVKRRLPPTKKKKGGAR
jgi:uncharacterized integral membrane protein